ncbi:hypothetical protein AB0N05_02645 [Nocardia sp. NPDC051030]|uniref:hypothetical protein n=1 Tax=Nocardia sp. NPDC051030 TaxID=3155162 RepID=UPI00344639B0
MKKYIAAAIAPLGALAIAAGNANADIDTATSPTIGFDVPGPVAPSTVEQTFEFETGPLMVDGTDTIIVVPGADAPMPSNEEFLAELSTGNYPDLVNEGLQDPDVQQALQNGELPELEQLIDNHPDIDSPFVDSADATTSTTAPATPFFDNVLGVVADVFGWIGDALTTVFHTVTFGYFQS